MLTIGLSLLMPVTERLAIVEKSVSLIYLYGA